MAGLLGAYFGNPNIQRQGARARELAKQRDVNLLADPKTYAVVQGLLGNAPDQLGFSVLNPKYQEIKQVAEPAFYLGTLLQAAPLLAPMTKNLPVGASIKNVGKSFVYPQDDALRLAQQRAALPKSQHGLGLPPDNTPQMRAAAMKMEPRMFHETSGKNIEAGLDSFDVKRVGAAASDEQTPYALFVKPHGESIGVAREQQAQMPLYIKSNLTDENVMRSFLDRDDLQQYLNQFPDIKEATTAVRNLDNKMAEYISQIEKKADALQAAGKKDEANKLYDQLNFDSPLMKEFDARTNELAAIAKEKITKHFQDQGYGSVGLAQDKGAMGRSVVTEMILNPSENVRSQFAAFDPWRRTAAIAAATGVAAPNIMAQEIDYTLLQPKKEKKVNNFFEGLLGQ